jgi:hypothetical protein
MIPIIHEAEHEYHGKAKHYLSSHQLADFRKCPELLRRKRSGLIPDSQSSAYLIGRATHCLILEGEVEFDDRYLIGGGPVNDRTGKPFGRETKAFAEWKADEPRDVISDTQGADVIRMADAVATHPEAQALLSTGEPEAVVRIDYCGSPSQIRMDWWRSDSPRFVDLKTCDDLDWFEADARRFGYLHQMAFYAGVIEAAGHVFPNVSIIAVEKKNPIAAPSGKSAGRVCSWPDVRTRRPFASFRSARRPACGRPATKRSACWRR